MTLQQTPEKRPNKIDLNLLPAEFRPAKKSKLTILLVLVAVLLACALAPVFLAKTGIDSDIKPLEAKLTALDATLAANKANNAEAVVILAQYMDNVSKLAVMQSDYRQFVSTRILWSAILEEVDDLTPRSKITAKTIYLADTYIKIEGTATKRQYIIDYETAIEASDFFKGITFSFDDNATGDPVTFKVEAPFDMSYISSTNNASLNSSK